MKSLNLPCDLQQLKNLCAGDTVYLSGTVYTARDAAHKKMHELLKDGKPLPFDINNQCIYYVGPCPAPNDKPIGSAGPTSSYRMDKFTPELLDLGLKCIIGKGDRNNDVVNSLIKNSAVYFTALGGLGALYASKITKCEIVAFSELLSEAVYKLEIKDFPVIVAIDSKGKSIY